MNVLGIIPARYGSTRFPGKPLAMLGSKTIVQRVYERSKQAVPELCVATDDQRIIKAVENFGGLAVMTMEKHRSGTDRCFEALGIMEKKTERKFDIVVNIQGDEPFIDPLQISQLISLFTDPSTQIATLGKVITENREIFDTNKPKLVIDQKGFALMFSRSPIPFIRDLEKDKWPGSHRFIRHIGIYAYRADVLERITSLPQGELEIAESLEQLRWLENGYRIKVGMTVTDNPGIDTPEDLERARKQIGE